MKGYCYICIFCLMLFSKISIAAECMFDMAVGKVTRIEWSESDSHAYIIRAGATNERVELEAFKWLCGDDRIEITDDTRVFISLANREQKTCSRHTLHSDCILPGNTNKKKSKLPPLILEPSQKLIPVFNVVRSIRSVYIANDPLLPSGVQYLPYGYEKAALLWRNGPAEVKLMSANKEIKFHSRNRAHLTIELPKEWSDLKISLPGISWNIQKALTPPVPEELNGFDSESLSDRLARALWILKNGPDEWSLFALSELEDLSNSGFFAAEELWHMALTGELADALVGN